MHTPRLIICDRPCDHNPCTGAFFILAHYEAPFWFFFFFFFFAFSAILRKSHILNQKIELFYIKYPIFDIKKSYLFINQVRTRDFSQKIDFFIFKTRI